MCVRNRLRPPGASHRTDDGRRHRRPSDRVPAAARQGHRLSPSGINYRANIDALKRAGVTDLISVSACGSFKPELLPGAFRARRSVHRPDISRESSFFGNGCVAHVSMAHPVSPLLRNNSPPLPRPKTSLSCKAAPMSCIEGPQFSSLAEILTYRQLGLRRHRHDRDAGSQARARGRDVLRDRRHGHRFRLLASRP